MGFLTLTGVGKEYRTGSLSVTALSDVSFELEDGEFVVILGSSGAGKTTLLNLLGGMDNATSGEIILDGKNVTALDKRGMTQFRRNDVGFVFQFYNLMPNLTALENVEIAPETVMLDIIEDGEECFGIVVKDRDGVKKVYADYTILACGGIGGIFEKSTNFRILTGDGVAVCLKHGVAVDNIDYIQIHPTTLYSEKSGRCFLISESVRGEGARLLDKNFNRFCDELQPRDVVTANILKKMKEDGTKHVWLDLRPIPEEEVKSHFPSIAEKCREEGYDVFAQPIPVVPAQHYFMGGIRSGLNGATTLKRLYAVGETCCNGVHGANRLASNSLLESLLFAKRSAQDIASAYSPADAKKAEKITVDFSVYGDTEKLFAEYKELLLKKIAEARDDRLKG